VRAVAYTACNRPDLLVIIGRFGSGFQCVFCFQRLRRMWYGYPAPVLAPCGVVRWFEGAKWSIVKMFTAALLGYCRAVAGINWEPCVMNLTYAVALLVGPKELEIDRSNDLLDAIGGCEPARCRMVVIDDSPEDRMLKDRLRFPRQVEPEFVKFNRPRRVGFKEAKGVCGNSLLGFQWIARHAPEAAFGMKIDTDALVIAPFAQKLAREFDAAPSIGVLGANTRTPEGHDRDIKRNAGLMKRLHARPIDMLHPISLINYLKDWWRGGPVSTIRKHLTEAVIAGYEYGENCLGGAYAIRQSCLAEMNQRGYLDRPEYWTPIDVPEELMMHMYARAAGFGLKNYVSPGEVFGIRFIGLPFELQELLDRGYSIIHSVKNDKRYGESEVREFFRAHRLKGLIGATSDRNPEVPEDYARLG